MQHNLRTLIVCARYSYSYCPTLISELEELTIYEVDRFVENQARVALNDIEPIDRADRSDLDEAALSDYLRRVREQSGGRTQRLTEHEILRNRGILSVAPEGEDADSRPTVAGLLAFGTDPQRFFPRLGVVVTVHPTDVKSAAGQVDRFLDRITVDGTIPEMVVATVRAVARNMRHGARIEGALRQDTDEYPLEAVREAVANALIHRDYSPDSWGAPVTVELYPSRLVISNPGGLFGTVTVEQLERSSATQSRNQYLSRILEDVTYRDADGSGHVVENAGSGIPLIRNALADAGLRPARIESSLDRFTITFTSRTDAATAVEDTGASAHKVFEALEQCGQLGTKALSETTGLSAQTVRLALERLMARGLVEGLGRPRSPKRAYRIVQ